VIAMAKPQITKRQVLSSKVFSTLFASILTYNLLYGMGAMTRIIAYAHPMHLPTIKLIFLHIVVFTTMAFWLNAIISPLMKMQWKPILITICIGLISLFMTFYIDSFSPPGSKLYVGWSYIAVGDYLRDIHGINIYYMDWTGWGLTFIPYVTILFSYLWIQIINHFWPKLFKTS
jgi:hypothetical protein